jgi:hypothetical protein
MQREDCAFDDVLYSPEYKINVFTVFILHENTYTEHFEFVCNEKVMIPRFSDDELGKKLIIYSGKYGKFIMRIDPKSK